MSASLLKCNQCTSYWTRRTNYIRATCKQCVHGKWLVGAHLNEDLSQLSFLAQPRQLFCSIQATDLQERESSTRVVGREARLGFCLLIAFTPFAIFSFILSSYFCFLVPFNIPIPCYILISAFSLRSRFFSHFLIFAFSSRLKFFSFLISAFSISIFFRSLSYKFLLASLHRIFPLYPSSVFSVLYPTSYIIEQRHLIYSRSEI